MSLASDVHDDGGNATGSSPHPATKTTTTTNAHMKSEICSAGVRLERVAQNFSIEWKKFLAYAMAVKQSPSPPATATTTTSATADHSKRHNELEDLLLHSHSGLVMLREMKHKRERKWREITQRYNNCDLFSLSPSPSPLTTTNAPAATATTCSKCTDAPASVTARLLAFYHERAHVSRVFLARKRLHLDNARDPDATQAHAHAHARERAAVELLAHATQRMHRLTHAVGIAVNSTGKAPADLLHAVEQADVDALLRFTHARLRMTLPLERLLTRMQWLCTSHRFYLQQRMLTLLYTQRIKNEPYTCSSKATAADTTGGLVHCPLFVLSPDQLDVQLTQLAQRFLSPQAMRTCRQRRRNSNRNRSKEEDTAAGEWDVVALRVHVEQVLVDAMDATAALVNDAQAIDSRQQTLLDAWNDNTTSLFALKKRRTSHWEMQQHDVLERTRETNVHSAGDSANVVDNDDDPLLATEWALLQQLDDSAYVRLRVEVLARSHFERARIDLRSPLLASAGVSAPLNDTSDDRLSVDALYALYLLRIVACCTARQQLLRLLNYCHYVGFTQRCVVNSTDADATKRHAPASYLCVKKRQQSDVVVVLACHSGDANTETTEAREVILPTAREDLATLERHMQRIANAFVAQHERASLPNSVQDTTDATESVTILAIDRMQVICDAYDCEVRFLQAKLQYVDVVLASGVAFSNDNNDKDESTDAICTILARRPLVDFTHAYFYESFAVETLLVDLQTQVHQQVHEHVVACEEETEDADADARTWLERQLICADAHLRLHHALETLFQQAEEQWMCVRSVSERHALHQAIYEQLVITWRVIVTVELAIEPAQCLGCSSDALFTDVGWQLVFPLQLLANCCRNAQQSIGTSAERGDAIAMTLESLALVEWHDAFGRDVYESNVLQRIYAFQTDFCTLHTRDSVAPFFFFPGNAADDTDDADGVRLEQRQRRSELVPIARDVLGERLFTILSTRSRATGATTKTLSDWLEAQFVRSDASDWREAFTTLERQWTQFLSAAVMYHDLVGCDVFDFAAKAPFVILDHADAQQAQVQPNDCRTSASAFAKAVESKFADAIAAKIQDAMHQRCDPYWTSLTHVKTQLTQLYGAGDANNNSSVVVECDPLRFAACAAFLRVEAAVPIRLVSVDRLLVRMRNEHSLMQTATPHTQQHAGMRTACAFALGTHPTCSTTRCTLLHWLLAKLQQLQCDLGDAASAKQSSGSPATVTRGAFEASDEPTPHPLLLALPTQAALIEQFAVPLCRELPTTAAACTTQERIETLELLGTILTTFHVALDLLRVQSSIHVVVKRLYRPALSSNITSTNNSSSLYERWQVLYHHEIRAFHDRIVASLPPPASTCSVFTRASSNDNNKRSRDALSSHCEKLVVICECVQQTTDALASSLHCIATLLLLQTIGDTQLFARSSKSDDTRQQSSRYRYRLRSCLLRLSTQLQATSKRDRPPSAARSYSTASRLAQSAAELLNVMDSAPPAVAATTMLSERERETSAFWDELLSVQYDASYTQSLAHWLELQRVFICEHVRTTSCASSNASLCDGDVLLSSALAGEAAAIAALDSVWDRYELVVPAHEVASDSDASSSIPGPPATSAARATTPQLQQQCRRGSFAQRRALTVRSAVGSKHARLPLQRKLEHQTEFLCLCLALEWIQHDIMTMEQHYEAFLDEKQRSQSEPTTAVVRGTTDVNDARRSHTCPAERVAPLLLSLSQYYRPADAGSDCDARTGSSTDTVVAVAATTHRDARTDAFVIPPSALHVVLQDVAASCVRYDNQQHRDARRYTAGLQQQLVDAQATIETLHTRTTRDAAHELLQRDAHALDVAYALRFRVATLEQALRTVESRVACERLELECALRDAFAHKLAAMHAQLVTKQQHFEAHRIAIQHDLQLQLETAQTQLVHDLVDRSGAVTVEAKAALLAELHRDHALDAVRHENVALKQTLLKLQALLEMQQQTLSTTNEREQMQQRRHVSATRALRLENAQLQQHVTQLESDLGRLSQEKTNYMLKWSSLHKQTEAAAQHKREAKIRALSAPFYRNATTHVSSIVPTDDGDTALEAAAHGSNDSGDAASLVAAAMGVAPHAVRTSRSAIATTATRRSRKTVASDIDDDDEAFEHVHEVAIRQRLPASASAATSGRSNGTSTSTEQRYESSTRHYQNEIKRLQQQLVRESRAKLALMEQVTLLRSQQQQVNEDGVTTSNQQLGDRDDDDDASDGATRYTDATRSTSSSKCVVRSQSSALVLRASGGGSAAGRTLVARSPAASPRTRAQSASLGGPARPPPQRTGGSATATNRPSASFSPRSAALHAATESLVVAPHDTVDRTIFVGAAPPALPPSTRRFEVLRRSIGDSLGGVAGASSPLSARERLPYR